MTVMVSVILADWGPTVRPQAGQRSASAENSVPQRVHRTVGGVGLVNKGMKRLTSTVSRDAEKLLPDPCLQHQR
jgi:hypothetical protein